MSNKLETLLAFNDFIATESLSREQQLTPGVHHIEPLDKSTCVGEALIVGIYDYSMTPRYGKRSNGLLQRVKYDVHDIARFLYLYNYHVRVVYQQEYKTTRSQIQEFLTEAAANKEKTFFLYLAGHGLVDAQGKDYRFVTFDPESETLVNEVKVEQAFSNLDLKDSHMFICIDTCTDEVLGDRRNGLAHEAHERVLSNITAKLKNSLVRISHDDETLDNTDDEDAGEVVKDVISYISQTFFTDRKSIPERPTMRLSRYVIRADQLWDKFGYQSENSSEGLADDQAITLPLNTNDKPADKNKNAVPSYAVVSLPPMEAMKRVLEHTDRASEDKISEAQKIIKHLVTYKTSPTIRAWEWFLMSIKTDIDDMELLDAVNALIAVEDCETWEQFEQAAPSVKLLLADTIYTLAGKPETVKLKHKIAINQYISKLLAHERHKDRPLEDVSKEIAADIERLDTLLQNIRKRQARHLYGRPLHHYVADRQLEMCLAQLLVYAQTYLFTSSVYGHIISIYDQTQTKLKDRAWLEQLQKAQHDIEHEMACLASEQASLEQERDRLNRERSAAHDMREAIEEIKENLDRERRVSKRLSDDNKSFMKDIEEQKDQLKQLKEKDAASDIEIRSQRKSITRLKEQLIVKNKKIIDLTTQVETKSKLITELETQAQTLQPSLLSRLLGNPRFWVGAGLALLLAVTILALAPLGAAQRVQLAIVCIGLYPLIAAMCYAFALPQQSWAWSDILSSTLMAFIYSCGVVIFAFGVARSFNSSENLEPMYKALFPVAFLLPLAVAVFAAAMRWYSHKEG